MDKIPVENKNAMADSLNTAIETLEEIEIKLAYGEITLKSMKKIPDINHGSLFERYNFLRKKIDFIISATGDNDLINCKTDPVEQLWLLGKMLKKIENNGLAI